MKRRPSLKRIGVVFGAICALAPAAQADILDYSVAVGVGESDNITRVPDQQINQTLAIANFNFALQQRTRLLSVDAKGNFGYIDFLQHAYSNELIGRFDGLGKFALIPERLTWVLQDDFGVAQVDPFAAVTPTNQEKINYLSTGPDLTLRFGSLGFAEMTARYARAQYAVSPFNNNRLLGSAELGRELSSRSKISLVGSASHVVFDNAVANSDFNRSSGYVAYAAVGARTKLTVNLGATKVTQGALSKTGPLAKLELSRDLSPHATLTLAGGRDLTDASTSFSALQAGAIGAVGVANGVGTIGTAPAALTSLNYTGTYGSAGWRYQRERSTLNLSGRWERDGYDGQPQFDRDLADAELRIDRRVTRSLSVQVLGSVSGTRYAHVDFTDRYSLAGAGLTWRATRDLDVSMRYDHLSRTVVGVGSGYKENVVYLMVGYLPRSNTPYSEADNQNEP